MPDSDSGQCSSNRLPTPEGWQPYEGAVIHPDWRELRRPDRLTASERKIRERIERDPELQRVFNERYVEEVGRLIWERDKESFDRLVAIASDMAERYRPAGTSPHAVARFLLVRWFTSAGISDEETLNATWGRIEPVELFANTVADEYDMKLRRGEFGMRFTGATGRDREALDGLIRDAQHAFGYGEQPTTRRRNQAKVEQEKTVAKLVALGWTGPEIAAFMGWSGSPEVIDTKVQRYNTRGTSHMRLDAPDWPNGATIPSEGPAKRSGLIPKNASINR